MLVFLCIQFDSIILFIYLYGRNYITCTLMLTHNILCSDNTPGVSSPHLNNKVPGPVKKYDEMVQNGKLRLDKYQRTIVEQLQRLYNDAVNYQPNKTGFLSKVCRIQQ